MTHPNDRNSSSETLRSIAAPEPRKEPARPEVEPTLPQGSPQLESGSDRRGGNVFERVTPTTKSAPRLVAKEFTIPSGWFRAPAKAETSGAKEAISRAIEGGPAADAPSVSRRPLIIAMFAAAAVAGVLMALQSPPHQLKKWAAEIPSANVAKARPVAATTNGTAPTATAEAAQNASPTSAPSSPSARSASTTARAKPTAPPAPSAKVRPPIY